MKTVTIRATGPIDVDKSYVLIDHVYIGPGSGSDYYTMREYDGEGVGVLTSPEIKRVKGYLGGSDSWSYWADGLYRVEEIVSSKGTVYGKSVKVKLEELS